MDDHRFALLKLLWGGPFDLAVGDLATGSGVALGLGDGTGETLLLLGLSECKEPVD